MIAIDRYSVGDGSLWEDPLGLAFQRRAGRTKLPVSTMFSDHDTEQTYTVEIAYIDGHVRTTVTRLKDGNAIVGNAKPYPPEAQREEDGS